MDFKHGVSTTRVELGMFDGKEAVFKRFKTESKWQREVNAYMKLSSCLFVPKLLFKSMDEKLIVTQYQGQSLNLKYKPEERQRFKEPIRKMHESLVKEYGMYHNDIRWKNVVEHENGWLYLIDFESWTPACLGSKERDPEKILS